MNEVITGCSSCVRRRLTRRDRDSDSPAQRRHPPVPRTQTSAPRQPPASSTSSCQAASSPLRPCCSKATRTCRRMQNSALGQLRGAQESGGASALEPLRRELGAVEGGATAAARSWSQAAVTCCCRRLSRRHTWRRAWRRCSSTHACAAARAADISFIGHCHAHRQSLSRPTHSSAGILQDIGTVVLRHSTVASNLPETSMYLIRYTSFTIFSSAPCPHRHPHPHPHPHPHSLKRL